MQPIFAVSVHDIDAGGLARSFELPLSWLESTLGDTDVSATGPGHADVRLSRTGNDVIVRGKVRATLTQPCARCLRPTEASVEGELSLVLRPARVEVQPVKHAHGAHGHGASHAHGASHKDAKDAGKRAGGKDAQRGNGSARRPREDEEEYEFSSEEADHDVYDGETVVLDEFLREALLLEVPSFPLCSEDCPGIRPAARTAPQREEPMDPRLSPLRALKTKLMLASGPEAAKASPPPSGGEASESPEPRASETAPARPARAGQPPRPKIQAHRTAGSIGGRGGSKKSKSRAPKKAK